MAKRESALTITKLVLILPKLHPESESLDNILYHNDLIVYNLTFLGGNMD